MWFIQEETISVDRVNNRLKGEIKREVSCPPAVWVQRCRLSQFPDNANENVYRRPNGKQSICKREAGTWNHTLFANWRAEKMSWGEFSIRIVPDTIDISPVIHFNTKGECSLSIRRQRLTPALCLFVRTFVGCNFMHVC